MKQRSILAEGIPPPFKVNYSTYTTVLVKRGTLRTGDFIVAGSTYAKVRRMTTADGKSVKEAPPGTPVEVTGWKERPNAGDLVLQAPKESNAKLAVRNRIQAREQRRDQESIDAINERRLANRKILWQEREKKMVAADINLFRKEKLLKDSGYTIKNQFE